ncbi:hypothetical protein AX17_002989 [Amanita inopinata Kibby_2008]|nr:hypothetical protein AX17_002989 [Amanita inopinata Kibby_2008]
MRLITVFSIASLLVGSAIAVPRNADRESFVARDYDSNARRHVGRFVQFEARSWTPRVADPTADCRGILMGSNVDIIECRQSYSGTGWYHGGTCYDPKNPSHSDIHGLGDCYKNPNIQGTERLMVLADTAARHSELSATTTKGRSATSSRNRWH